MNTPSKSKLNQALQGWLVTLPHWVPLRATSSLPTIDGLPLEHWIAEAQLSRDSLVTAMLWLRIGVIDPTHQIVQDGKTPLASYMHGVVHRLEGDYSNAKYWFRQVKDTSMLQTLSQSMERGLNEEGLLAEASNLKIMQSNRLHPSELVTAVERQTQQSNLYPDEVKTLERISWLEWTCLWELSEAAQVR